MFPVVTDALPQLLQAPHNFISLYFHAIEVEGVALQWGGSRSTNCTLLVAITAVD